jgi:hypothetical protein
VTAGVAAYERLFQMLVLRDVIDKNLRALLTAT